MTHLAYPYLKIVYLHLTRQRHAYDGQTLQNAFRLPHVQPIKPSRFTDLFAGLGHHLQDQANVETQRGGTNRRETVHVSQQSQRNNTNRRHHNHHPCPEGATFVDREHLGRNLGSQISHHHKVRDTRAQKVSHNAQFHQQLPAGPKRVERNLFEGLPPGDDRRFDHIATN